MKNAGAFPPARWLLSSVISSTHITPRLRDTQWSTAPHLGGIRALEATKILDRLAHWSSPNGATRLQRCLLDGHTNHSGNLRTVESSLVIKILGMGTPPGCRRWLWAAEFDRMTDATEVGSILRVRWFCCLYILHYCIFLVCIRFYCQDSIVVWVYIGRKTGEVYLDVYISIIVVCILPYLLSTSEHKILFIERRS